LIGKLIIIGIIIAAVAIFVPSSSKFFQSVPSSIDTVKGKIDQVASNKQVINDSKLAIKDVDLGAKLLENNSGILSSANSIPNTASNNNSTSVYRLAPQYVTRQNYTGQVFEKNGNTCQISVPELAQTINGIKQLTGIIQLDQCKSNVGDPVQVTELTAKPNSPPVDVSSGLIISPYSGDGSTTSTTLPSLPSYYQTIKLTMINQGNNVVLNFDDTSGQTKSVTVTLKNTDNVLFSGTFYSSQFSTQVNDVPNTPHIIEMIIDNAIYGILHASAYAPSNVQNSTITGILSQ
jgi:gas vesicle protein